MNRPFDVRAILIGGLATMLIIAVVITVVVMTVGEIVEHFTP